MASVQLRQVVTAFLLRRGVDGPTLFAVRRSGRVGTYAGCWSGISGYLEDEPEPQARREVEEETGLGNDDLSLLAAAAPLTVEDGALAVRWRVHPFAFEVVSEREPALDWENVEGRWLPPPALAALETVPGLLPVMDAVLPPPLAWPAPVAAARESLRADRSSGAADLALAAARALVEAVAQGADPEAAAVALALARPSMAAVGSALRFLLAAGPTAVSLARLEAERAQGRPGLATRAASVLPARVLTLSSSRSVTDALLSSRPELTVVAESRPLLEGRRTAATLADGGLAVRLVTDAALAAALPEVQALALGADSVLADGSAVNKTGSLAAALAARNAGLDVFVLAETSKVANRTWFVVEEMAPAEVWMEAPGGVAVANPYFERVPPELITAFITERGVLSPIEMGATARGQEASW